MINPHAGGISRDLAKQRDWQQRGARRYAERRHDLQRAQARLTTRIEPTPTAPPRPRNDWKPRIRKLAAARSGGICELDGVNQACHLHHRKLRANRDHRIENALHVCWECHELIHARGNRGSIEASKLAGWLVSANADPAKITVRIAGGQRVLLDDRGRYQDAA
jgi:hypothetical protein